MATQGRGGWAKAGVPSLEHFMKIGAWFAGTSDELIEHLKKLEAPLPGHAAYQPVHQPVHA
jgi:hypothetical protein